MKKIKNSILALIMLSGFMVNIYPQSGWSVVNTGTTLNINNICAVDTSYIFAAADGGSILRSTNGGLNWEVINTNFPIILTSISFVNRDTGYAVGSGTVLIKTTNSGLNWFQAYTFEGRCYYMKFFSKYCGVVMYYNSTPYPGVIKCARTTNGGSNWSINWVDYGYLSSYNHHISFLDSLNGYMFVVYLMYKTYNGGVTWYYASISPSNTYNWIYNFVDANTGFIQLTSGGLLFVVRKTTDGGNSFSDIYSTGINSLFPGYFINDSTGYISTPNGPILYTSNSGLNWVSQYSAPVNGLDRMFFVNDNLGFATGFNGIMLRTSNGGNPIGIQQTGNDVPNTFRLSQNYPNPFNPSTKIKFDISKISFTKLTVYDILGREITVLVNEELKPGTYEAEWNAENFSGGIYFCRLFTNDKIIDSKKMILIK